MNLNELENYVLLHVSAEWYYSGSSVNRVTVMLKSDYEKYKEDISNLTFTFYELDGKHSEVEWELNIMPLWLKGSIKTMIDTINNSDWSIEELWDLLPENILDNNKKILDTIIDSYKIETVTKYYFNWYEITQ